MWVRPLGIDFQLAIAVAIAIYCLSLWARRTHCLDRPRPAPDLSHPIPSYLILHCTTPPVRHIKFASPSLYVITSSSIERANEFEMPIAVYWMSWMDWTP